MIHGHGGGTEHHARALIDASRTRYRHYLAIAVGDRGSSRSTRTTASVRTFDLARGDGETWPEFVGGICATFGIDLVHLHNITGCRDGIFEALAALDVPYGYTVHDFTFACPTILFLGVDGNVLRCAAPMRRFAARCLARAAAFARIDIVAWRDAPSRTARARIVPASRRRVGRRRRSRVTFAEPDGRRNSARRARRMGDALRRRRRR